MIGFLPDPNTTLIECFLAAAFIGVVGLWLLSVRIVRERRGDIDRPLVPLLEINEAHEEAINADDPDIEIDSPVLSSVGLRRSATPLRICFAVAFVLMILTGARISYVDYNILQSWTIGEEMLSKKDFVGAEKQYRRAVSLDPRIRKSHLLLAEALLGGADPLRALPELKLAAQGERSDPTVYMLLGDELAASSKLSEAVQEYRQAISISPTRAAPYVHLATCLALLKRSKDAVKELRYAILLDPKNSAAKSTLGQILVATGDNREGLACLKQAVELAPEDVTTHNNLGCGYARAKRYAEAIAEFRAGLAINPYFAMAYYNLGSALRDIGDVDGAIQAFEAYIDVCKKRPLFRSRVFSAEIELHNLKKGQAAKAI